MRASEVVSFVAGYCIISVILHVLPTITMYPVSTLVYRDDDGVCYTYDREEVAC